MESGIIPKSYPLGNSFSNIWLLLRFFINIYNQLGHGFLTTQALPGSGVLKLEFDEEELKILRDFEHGEFESIHNFSEEKRKLEETASC